MAPSSAAEWKAAGNALFGAKQYVEAAAAYSRAIELEPEDAVFHSNRCACLLKLGQLDAALADALRLRELRPTWAKSHFREGSVLAAMGRCAPSLRAASVQLRISPHHFCALTHGCQTMVRCVAHPLGRHTDAAHALCAALQLEPNVEVEGLLRESITAAGLYDIPEHQQLLQRCLLLLARGTKPTGPSSSEATLAVEGTWKRVVLPAVDGPRARAGATLSAVGSTLWLIGGLLAQAGEEEAGPQAAVGADGSSVHCLETNVGPSLRHSLRQSPLPSCSPAHALPRSCVAPRPVRLAMPLPPTHLPPCAYPCPLRPRAVPVLCARIHTEPSSWVAEHTRAPDGPPPVSRGGHGACVRGSEIWTFGGQTAAGVALGDVHALDTRLRTWRRINALPEPAPRHAHCLLYEGGSADRLLLFGGAGAQNEPLGDLHALRLHALPVGALPLAGGAARAASVGDGRVRPRSGGAEAPASEGGEEAPAAKPGVAAGTGATGPLQLRWEAVATSGSPPAPREMHAAALVPTLPPPHVGEASAPAAAPASAPATATSAAHSGLSASYMVIHGGRSGGRVLSDLWVLHLGERSARLQRASSSLLPACPPRLRQRRVLGLSPSVRSVCPFAHPAHPSPRPVCGRVLACRVRCCSDAGTHSWQCIISGHALCSHGLSLRPSTGSAHAGRAGCAELLVFGGHDGRSERDSTLLLTLTEQPTPEGAEPAGRCEARWADLSAELKGAPKARFAHAQASTARALYVFGGAHDGRCIADTNKLSLLSA